VINSIVTGLASIDRFIRVPPFSPYERALDELEWEFRIRAGEQASRFGLQWALVLIIILRAYMAEMKLRVLVTSLPIFNFYSQYLFDSYIGVCFWEAISGKPLKTPSLPNILDIEVPTDNRYKLKPDILDQFKAQDERLGYIVRQGTEQGALIGSLTCILDAAHDSAFVSNNGKAIEVAAENPANTPEDIESLVTKFLATPIIKKSYPPEKNNKSHEDRKKDKRPPGPLDRYLFQDITIDAFENEAVYRNPVILRGPAHNVCVDSPHRPSYYSITNIDSNPVSLLNFGNTFSTQLLFYVASHLLSKVSEHFNLDAFYQRQIENARKDKSTIRNLLRNLESYKKKDESQYKLYLKDNLKLKKLIEKNRFNLNCGSYLHGGSYPPHKTHREGRHFDIIMGPDLIPWRTTGLREALSKAYNYLQNHPMAGPAKLNELRFKSTIYLCERSASDVGKKTVALLDDEFMKKGNSLFTYI